MNSTQNRNDQIAMLLKCVGRKENGGIKFITALKAETLHDGHRKLLKILPSIEGTCMCMHSYV